MFFSSLPAETNASRSSLGTIELLRRVFNADLETLANRAKRLIDVLDGRAVIKVEKPVYLRPVPAETPCKLCLRHPLTSHRTIELDFGYRKRRKPDQTSMPLLRGHRRQRDFFASRNSSGKRLLDRIRSPVQRILNILPEGRYLPQVRAGHENSTVVIACQDYRVH
jgi:hypothetical protein